MLNSDMWSSQTGSSQMPIFTMRTEDFGLETVPDQNDFSGKYTQFESRFFTIYPQETSQMPMNCG